MLPKKKTQDGIVGGLKIIQTRKLWKRFVEPFFLEQLWFFFQDSYGDTVLHDAIAKDFSEIFEYLVNFRGVDLSVKNKRGFNCLHHAALKGNSRSVCGEDFL